MNTSTFNYDEEKDIIDIPGRINWIMDKYKDVSKISDDLNNSLLNLGCDKTQKPKSETQYTLCNNAYDLIIVKILINIIQKLNNSEKFTNDETPRRF